MNKFNLHSTFSPAGDQPQAIEKITTNLKAGKKYQTLLGVTGSGKTFTMANVIAQAQKPTLIISHNKTLAAQLAEEFKNFFPNNAVHYFVSYYDYYQPEAYLPQTGTYIEKETSINEEIDRLRHASTQSLLSRQDVIIVASVSCIYGLGSPDEYKKESFVLQTDQPMKMNELAKKLVALRYVRNDYELKRGAFRIKGDTLDIYQPYSLDELTRVEFFGNKIEKISLVNFLNGHKISDFTTTLIFPATHYLASQNSFTPAIEKIRHDLKLRFLELKKADKLAEAQRLEQRTLYDLEMLTHTGYCNGIENYSRYFDGRNPGEPPYTLIDFFPKDFLMFIDESHMTIPQIGSMFAGDKARKQNLIDYGFRLPAAFDNRPLNFKEFEKKINQVVFVSATPSYFELEKSTQSGLIEQLIRPTGLLDPAITIKPAKHQIDDLIQKIRETAAKNQRILVTTLTKRMAEDLSDYLQKAGIKAYYLHSEISTFERIEILQDLRLGKYDVVVGINLLREGLDLPEVSLVAILDADKEGYLRSETALLQTMGRAARHVEGQVIMYADQQTNSMKRALEETIRRRKIQTEYNLQHRITPQSIQKEIKSLTFKAITEKEKITSQKDFKETLTLSKENLVTLVKELTDQMDLAAKNLEFEKAAALRDKITTLTK
ncbi:MAG TPA: excinuclease ABC subunit UvrB [bacterium]|nr:excinuclease ABC subunit UvrB [bacterium]